MSASNVPATGRSTLVAALLFSLVVLLVPGQAAAVRAGQLSVNDARVDCPGIPSQQGPQTCVLEVDVEWSGLPIAMRSGYLACSFEVSAYCTGCGDLVVETIRISENIYATGGTASITLDGDVHFDVPTDAAISAAGVTDGSCNARVQG